MEQINELIDELDEIDGNIALQVATHTILHMLGGISIVLDDAVVLRRSFVLLCSCALGVEYMGLDVLDISAVHSLACQLCIYRIKGAFVEGSGQNIACCDH